MALPILDNIQYKGAKPNFTRDQFATVADMKAYSENFLPELYEAFVLENKKKYRFDKSNTVDSVLGKWREIIDGDPTAYHKPTNGIPASDFTSEVRSSLSKAESALQVHQSLSAYSTTAQMNAAIDSAVAGISNPSQFKGTVASTTDLPSSGNTTGDNYYVTAEEAYYKWNGSEWGEVEGQSNSLEAYNARTNAAGTAFQSLKARLDDTDATIDSVSRTGSLSVTYETQIGSINSSGAESDNTNDQYRRTTFIDASKCDSLKINRAGSGASMWYATYDSNKTFIEKVIVQETTTVTISLTNVGYVRIYGYKAITFTDDALRNIITVTPKRILALKTEVAAVDEHVAATKAEALAAVAAAAEVSKSDVEVLEDLTVSYDVGNVTDDITDNIVWELNKKWSTDGYASDTSYKITGKIPCVEGDRVDVTSTLNGSATHPRWMVCLDENDNVIASNEYTDGKVATEGTVAIVGTIAVNAVISSVTHRHTGRINKVNSAAEWVYGNNLLDTENLTANKYINKAGTMGSSNDYSVTDFIEVRPGQKICCGYGAYAPKRNIRYVCAYDINKSAVEASGAETVETYVVPEGIRYIRISILNATLANADFRICEGNAVKRYEPFTHILAAKGSGEINKKFYDLKNQPITTLGLTTALSYRPLGQLSKPYFCLVTDDGYEGVATYSIPTFVVGKSIPMTFGVAKTSPVLENPETLEVLMDALENNNCICSQHGFTRWTQFANEDQLNDFFDQEKEYFDSLGIEIKGAICPAHEINNTVRAVVGNRFGVVRTGYISSGNYPNNLNGPRSNIFGLDCTNLKDYSLDDNKARIDYAVSNNMLMIGFFHEWEIETADKTRIEAIVDYAISKNMEFITLDQIPYLI